MAVRLMDDFSSINKRLRELEGINQPQLVVQSVIDHGISLRKFTAWVAEKHYNIIGNPVEIFSKNQIPLENRFRGLFIQFPINMIGRIFGDNLVIYTADQAWSDRAKQYIMTSPQNNSRIRYSFHSLLDVTSLRYK